MMMIFGKQAAIWSVCSAMLLSGAVLAQQAAPAKDAAKAPDAAAVPAAAPVGDSTTAAPASCTPR